MILKGCQYFLYYRRLAGLILTFTASSSWVMFAMSSCKSSPTSNVKIDNGEVIYSGSSNKVEGVFYTTTLNARGDGGACTGTAVSTSTAITAAHCLYRDGDSVGKDGRILGKQYCIDTSAYKNICSTEVYVDPLYGSVAGNREHERGVGHDFGYVVFPKRTFHQHFRMNQGELTVGDDVVLVGYSEYNLPDPSKGSKRFGYNKIAKLYPQERSGILTLYQGGFSSVAVQPGDSGGPLLKNCQLTGVASTRGDGNDGDPNGSIHANVSHPEIQAILKSAKTAYFCGISGDDEAFCPKNQEYKSAPGISLDSRQFPCVIGPSL